MSLMSIRKKKNEKVQWIESECPIPVRISNPIYVYYANVCLYLIYKFMLRKIKQNTISYGYLLN